MEAMTHSCLDLSSAYRCIVPKQRSPLPASPHSSFSCLRSSSPRLSGLAVSGKDGGGRSLGHIPECSLELFDDLVAEELYTGHFVPLDALHTDDFYGTAEALCLPRPSPSRLPDHQPEDTFYDAVDLPWIGLQSRVAGTAPFNGLQSRVAGLQSRVAGAAPFNGLQSRVAGLQSRVAGAAPFNGVMGCAMGKMISTLFISSFFDHIVPSAAFASDHHRYMFNLGHYTSLATLFTFGLKAAMVAALGFTAGLAISSGLVWLQNRMDPHGDRPEVGGLRMVLSSNFRYQVLKGIEFLMAPVLPPAVLKDLVAVALCWLSNVLGNMLTPKDTDLLETDSHSKSDAKEYHVNDWGEGASSSGNIKRSQRIVHLKFLVPGGKWVCEVSVLRCFGSGGVIFDISVSPFYGSI